MIGESDQRAGDVDEEALGDEQLRMNDVMKAAEPFPLRNHFPNLLLFAIPTPSRYH